MKAPNLVAIVNLTAAMEESWKGSFCGVAIAGADGPSDPSRGREPGRFGFSLGSFRRDQRKDQRLKI